MAEFYIGFQSVNKKNCTLEFSFCQFCDVTHADNWPQEEELATFGYTGQRRKLTFLKNHIIYIGDQCYVFLGAT